MKLYCKLSGLLIDWPWFGLIPPYLLKCGCWMSMLIKTKFYIKRTCSHPSRSHNAKHRCQSPAYVIKEHHWWQNDQNFALAMTVSDGLSWSPRWGGALPLWIGQYWWKVYYIRCLATSVAALAIPQGLQLLWIKGGISRNFLIKGVHSRSGGQNPSNELPRRQSKIIYHYYCTIFNVTA